MWKKIPIVIILAILVVCFSMPALASSRLRSADTSTMLRPGVALEKETKEGDCVAWNYLPNYLEVTLGVDLEDLNRQGTEAGLIKDVEMKILKVFKF